MPAAESRRVRPGSGRAYFRQEGGVFLGNDPARGPWSRDHCHAGPVAALAARAAEVAAGPERRIARLALDLLRPAPVAGLRVEAKVARAGRTVTETAVEARDLDGRVCVSGRGLHFAHGDFGAFPTAPVERRDPDAAAPGPFPLSATHDLPSFLDFAEVRYPPGEGPQPGPVDLWMRCPAIVEGETPSPFQALCPPADCGNGLSGNASSRDFTFLNADLTVAMHRPPADGWIRCVSRSHWQSGGIGLSETALHDRHGSVGFALQTLLVRPREVAGADRK